MIKEKQKITKYNYKKTSKEIMFEYARTVFVSILFATIITSFLAIRARSEMIKNLYEDANVRKTMDKQIAQQIIEKSDIMNDLANKNYVICMNVGDLYYTAGDYKNAKYAYELAVEKAKPGKYKPYYKLLCLLVDMEDFDKAEALLENLKDHTDKELIKLKTRSYIVIGDKYYALGKCLSAAKSYENAKFYYDKFSKKDKIVDASIEKRIVNSYIQTADIMVKSNLNSEAVRFLKKAEVYEPDNFVIKYKLAIIMADSDPEKSVEYFEPLLEKMPQDIDYGVYDRALVKAANIADLDNRPTKAKYYRYKIHSIDMFINRKVVYKNDIETEIESVIVKKLLFTYPLKISYNFRNISNSDIIYLYGDFVLCYKDNPVETISKVVSNKDNPLVVYKQEPNNVELKFKRKIYTKKELNDYTIKIYLYKDPKYKTLVYENKIPSKSIIKKK